MNNVGGLYLVSTTSILFLVTESLGGFGSGHHQGQGTPPCPRGTYRSPTNTALTSAEGIEHTTFCKEVARSLPTELTFCW